MLLDCFLIFLTGKWVCFTSKVILGPLITVQVGMNKIRQIDTK